MHANIRIEDLELHAKVKAKAAKERKSIKEITENLLREYLKQPLSKSG